ncbi:GTPase-activating protein GYP2 [Pelomyxa schiedti]|nr:GTPase-activating protein GYP2 [Pelomyxa schiedti]
MSTWFRRNSGVRPKIPSFEEPPPYTSTTTSAPTTSSADGSSPEASSGSAAAPPTPPPLPSPSAAAATTTASNKGATTASASPSPVLAPRHCGSNNAVDSPRMLLRSSGTAIVGHRHALSSSTTSLPIQRGAADSQSQSPSSPSPALSGTGNGGNGNGNGRRRVSVNLAQESPVAPSFEVAVAYPDLFVQCFTQGVMLFSDKEQSSGRVVFDLKDIPLNKCFYTDIGTSVTRISPSEVVVKVCDGTHSKTLTIPGCVDTPQSDLSKSLSSSTTAPPLPPPPADTECTSPQPLFWHPDVPITHLREDWCILRSLDKQGRAQLSEHHFVFWSCDKNLNITTFVVPLWYYKEMHVAFEGQRAHLSLVTQSNQLDISVEKGFLEVLREYKREADKYNSDQYYDLNGPLFTERLDWFNKYLQPVREGGEVMWYTYFKKYGSGADMVKTTFLSELVHQGIPNMLRGTIWQIVCGAIHMREYWPGDLVQSTPEAVAEIDRDINRSMPDHPYYQTDEGQAELKSVLVKYARANPSIGYCQAMNIITALLLLYMQSEQALHVLHALCENILHDYFTPSMIGMMTDQNVLAKLISLHFKKVDEHLIEQGVPIPLFGIKWFMCLYINSLPYKFVLRIVDRVLSDGVLTLFRVALCVIKFLEEFILSSTDADLLIRQLTMAEQSPLQSVDVDEFFSEVDRMTFVTYHLVEKYRVQDREAITTELRESTGSSDGKVRQQKSFVLDRRRRRAPHPPTEGSPLQEGGPPTTHSDSDYSPTNSATPDPGPPSPSPSSPVVPQFGGVNSNYYLVNPPLPPYKATATFSSIRQKVNQIRKTCMAPGFFSSRKQASVVQIVQNLVVPFDQDQELAPHLQLHLQSINDGTPSTPPHTPGHLNRKRHSHSPSPSPGPLRKPRDDT